MYRYFHLLFTWTVTTSLPSTSRKLSKTTVTSPAANINLATLTPTPTNSSTTSYKKAFPTTGNFSYREGKATVGSMKLIWKWLKNCSRITCPAAQKQASFSSASTTPDNSGIISTRENQPSRGSSTVTLAASRSEEKPFRVVRKGTTLCHRTGSWLVLVFWRGRRTGWTRTWPGSTLDFTNTDSYP